MGEGSMKNDQWSWPRSLWHDTATPLDSCPALDDDIQCDVGIIGAGYTGLSSALHLAEEGVECVVLDQAQPGWGCSGRNGGQVNPMWKVLPDEVRKYYKPDEFDAMLDVVSQTCNLVYNLIDKYRIDCDAIRPGHIHTAVGKAQLDYGAKWRRQWRFLQGDVSELDRGDMKRLVGTDHYDGGTLAHGSGSVQPLSYARGLARAAMGLGATIYGDSQAMDIVRKNGRWHVSTRHGVLRCRNLILGTNGYTDQVWPGLHRTVVPVASVITATEPLDDEIAATITPQRHAVSESSGLPHYYRLDSQNRMVFGGRGAINGSIGNLDTRGLRNNAIRLFPSLTNATWQYDWGGYVAMTSHHRALLMELDQGAYAAMGYNGRGVAMATMMGKQLAMVVQGKVPDLALEKPKPIPFHGLYPLGIMMRMVGGRISDLLTRCSSENRPG